MSPIGIIGAGAIGCWIGGRVQTAVGADVVFVGRERLRGELAAGGLTVEELAGASKRVEPASLRYSTDPSALADCELVLCAVKSAQTAEIAGALAKILRPDATIVSLQNGVHNAAVLRAALGAPGARTVLAGIVGFNVVPRGNGVFKRATNGPLVIEAGGPPAVDVLAEAGLEVKRAQKIEPLQWSKLVINLGNAITALSGLPTKQLMLAADYRRILAATMKEAIGVLRAAGIDLGMLGPLPVRFFPLALALPAPILRVAAGSQLRIDPEARSSMWEDLAARRTTEVEYLNGEIVRVAREHGTDAPLNRRLIELIHEAEAKKSGSPQLSAEALWRAMTPAERP